MDSKQQAKPTLICTVGLPYAGKEVWAKTQGLPVVSLEVIQEQLPETTTQTKKGGHAQTLNQAKQLIQMLFSSGNPVVILLAENLTQKERDFWQSKDNEWQTMFREFQISENQALRAAEKAGASKAERDRIKALAKNYEPLN